MALIVTILLAACGRGAMTLTEYVEAVDEIQATAMEQYETIITSDQGRVLLVGQGPHMGLSGDEARLSDFTPQDLHAALTQVAAIQDEALERAAAIDPPEQIAELHRLYFRELPMVELAARAETAADWEELSASAEMEAYRAGLAADRQVCEEFQVQLDATAARGAFADVPWIPAELQEIVEFGLGCSSLPEHPEDVYRP